MSGRDTLADVTAPTKRGAEQTLAANERPEAEHDELARGTIVGRYVVLTRVGAGAMGVVYAAYDPDLDRKVAVKLLHAGEGADGGSTGHRRLLREAQAMAQLSHPNVVTVHDVGVYEGRVFVAMEFVQGRTLRAWLREVSPAWQEVLDVFVAAGRGLQAAHDQGLLHRDFKPDNVMLGEDRGARRVRVMDFGLARVDGDSLSRPATTEPVADDITGSRRTLDVALTQQGSIVGTPAYMAPEQIAREGSGPRADQFSFCVGLWEALFRQRPFAGDTFAALASNVLDGTVEPPPAAPAVPRWLRRVVQRGLARDPEQRWPSMAALLDALSRDRSRAQRRVALLALGVVGLAGAGAVAWDHAAEQRRVAECEAAGASIETVWNDGARETLQQALIGTGVSYAEATAERVVPWIDARASAWAEHRTEACLDARVRERAGWSDDVLDRAVWCLDERRMELDALVAELSSGTAESVPGAVRAAATPRPIDACLDRDRLLRLPAPPNDRRDEVEAVRAELSRAATLRDMARLDDGLAAANAALASAEDLAWPPLVATARARVGGLLEAKGEYTEAEHTLTQAYFEAAHAGATDVAVGVADDLAYLLGYRLARGVEGLTWSKHAEVHLGALPDPVGIGLANHLNNLAAIHWAKGEYAETLAVQQRVLGLRESALGPEHPVLARTLNNIAVAHGSLGAYDEAKALHERAVAITEAALGPEHPDVAMSIGNLAGVHWTMGDYPRARELHARALAIRERALGPDHADVAASLAELGLVARATGAYAEARELLERSLAIREKVYGPDHPQVANSLLNLANVFSDIGAIAEATAMYERALAIEEHALGPDHPDVATVLLNLANVRSEAGAHAEAIALSERALAIEEKTVGPDHLEVASVLHNLGDTYLAMRSYAEARSFYQRALAIFRRSLPPDHIDIATTLSNIGSVALETGDYAEARASFLRAVEIFEKTVGPAHPDIVPGLLGLGRLALREGRPAEALPIAERALAVLTDAGLEGRGTVEAQAIIAEAKRAPAAGARP